MRARSIASEAYRNLASGTTRALLLAIALATVGAGLAIADARSVVTMERRAAEFVSSGASVRVMVARKTTDAAACERLGGIPGVRSAGALRETEPVVLRAMAGNPIQAYAVTPGLIEVLGGVPAASAGAWLPAQLAETLGVRPGAELATGGGTLTVAGVYHYPDDGRDSRLHHAALLPQPAAGTFDECWADIWPFSEARDSLLHTAFTVDAGSSDPVTIGQLNTRLGTRFDGLGEFAGRPTRYAPHGCALAGLVLGFLAVRMRRLEIAGALHLGQSRRSLLATHLIETAAWSSAALLLAAAALVFGVVLGDTADPGSVYLIDIRGPVAATLAAHAGAVLALATIRERHLFGYFKNR
ncbi:hypothetical protein GCM10022225_33660 [Plantactinospora mayteni]|uniref:ABC transporter permease n=1 Tax=Plantactinospora mayteni TaxID=566021 RepID=A0ABQ4EL44_9ACTN|nr:hypothetical protein [Plantactinospora mayteni]GIG95470.1 hypothetical protein Pma05_20430 [Plantactinospora mayteni]